MFTSTLTVLVSAAAVLASTHQPAARHNAIAVSKRTNGTFELGKRDTYTNKEFTWYPTDTGPDACTGKTHQDSDYFVAMAAPQFGDGSACCGKQMSITVNGKTATASCVDECASCYDIGQLDFTKGLFEYFSNGDLDVGVLYGSWSYVGDGGNSGGDGGDGGDDTTTTTPKKTTTSTKHTTSTTSTKKTTSTTHTTTPTTTSTTHTTTSTTHSSSKPVSSSAKPSSSSAKPSSSSAKPSSSSAKPSVSPSSSASLPTPTVAGAVANAGSTTGGDSADDGSDSGTTGPNGGLGQGSSSGASALSFNKFTAAAAVVALVAARAL